MKKLLSASTLAFLLTQNSFLANAGEPDTGKALKTDTAISSDYEHPNKTRNDLVGFGSGALAGALIGGPVGGVIGGVFGIFAANDINDDYAQDAKEAELARYSQKLSQQGEQLLALQVDYDNLAQSQRIHLANVDESMKHELLAQWMQGLPNLESNVQFKTASFLVNDSYKGQLDSLARLLNQFPDLQVQVSGFADMRGDSQYNRILSEQRAIAIKDYLIGQSVKPEQIIAQGQGELALANTSPTSSSAESTNTAPLHQEALFFDRRARLKVVSNAAMMTAAAPIKPLN